jgi:hypothetical protein
VAGTIPQNEGVTGRLKRQLPASVARGTRRNVTWITSPSSRKALTSVGRNSPGAPRLLPSLKSPGLPLPRPGLFICLAGSCPFLPVI